jgi:hypothetical protein
MDECTFLPRSTKFYTWAASKHPLPLRYSWAPGVYVAVMGAISSERGQEHFQLKSDGAFKKEDFLDFIKALQRLNPDRKLMIFADQCRIHTAKLVQEYLKLHPYTLRLVFNLPYRPDLNGIELLWGGQETLPSSHGAAERQVGQVQQPHRGREGPNQPQQREGHRLRYCGLEMPPKSPASGVQGRRREPGARRRQMSTQVGQGKQERKEKSRE